MADWESASPTARGLMALRGRWLGGWDLIRATSRDSANAAARDCKAAALRQGLVWHYIECDEQDAGPGHNHRLWCCTARGERVPDHPAIRAGAKVVSDPPATRQAAVAPHVARTTRYLELLREGEEKRRELAAAAPRRLFDD